MKKSTATETCKVTFSLKSDPYKKGDEIKVIRVYFRNGENQVVGMINGKQVELPSVWTDLK